MGLFEIRVPSNSLVDHMCSYEIAMVYGDLWVCHIFGQPDSPMFLQISSYLVLLLKEESEKYSDQEKKIDLVSLTFSYKGIPFG